MSSSYCSNESNSCYSWYFPDFTRFIWIVILPFISIILLSLFICLCLRKKHRNRINTEQYPTVQQNDYSINSSDPPPYNWHSESPPPPPYSSKMNPNFVV